MVQRLSHFGMIASQTLLSDRQRSLKKRLCLSVFLLFVGKQRKSVERSCYRRSGLSLPSAFSRILKRRFVMLPRFILSALTAVGVSQVIQAQRHASTVLSLDLCEYAESDTLGGFV